jgi:dienelactone hydrolase
LQGSLPSARLLLAVWILCSTPAGAGEPALEHFFAAPELTGFQISPDGTHLAAIAPRDDDWRLVVLSIDPLKIVQEISVGKHPIRAFWWVNDERLLLSLSYNRGKEVRLAGTNRDGGRNVDFGNLIARERIPSEVRVIGLLPKSRRNILVAFGFDATPGFFATEVARFNAYTGRESILTGSGVRAYDWLVDPAGRLRFGYAQLHENSYYVYRDPGDVGWRSIQKVGGVDVDRLNFVPLGYRSADGEPFVASRHAGDHFALYTYDVGQDRFSEAVFAEPDLDVIGRGVFTRRAELVGVYYQRDDWRVRWLDPKWQARADRLERLLPDVRSYIVDSDEAEKRFVVEIEADRRPPLYALFEADPPRLRPLASLHRELEPAALADTRPVHYAARDGRSIPAYLTLPPGSSGPRPVVVLIHDGPWTPRSSIRFAGGRAGRGFDAEVQFLVSRGWAVFQPNFRGSTGYGYAHEAAGFGQWGRAMQHDVDDGVRWLQEQGIAAAGRVCLYGRGYGGYAAVQGLVGAPDLYRCAVAYDGVYDLPAFASSVDRFVYDEEIEKRMGSDGPTLASVSPARHAEKLQAPVLLVYGDEGGPGWLWIEDQFERMANALDEADRPHELLRLPEDGEGLRREANRLRFYRALEAFLEKQLAAPAPKA